MHIPKNAIKDKLENKKPSKLISTCKGKRLDPYLISYTEIISKCIKGLNIRNKAMKPLEENTREKLCGRLQAS